MPTDTNVSVDACNNMRAHDRGCTVGCAKIRVSPGDRCPFTLEEQNPETCPCWKQNKMLGEALIIKFPGAKKVVKKEDTNELEFDELEAWKTAAGTAGHKVSKEGDKFVAKNADQVMGTFANGKGTLTVKSEKSEAKQCDCPDCDGSGKVDGKDCETCGGSGKVDDDSDEDVSESKKRKKGDLFINEDEMNTMLLLEGATTRDLISESSRSHFMGILIGKGIVKRGPNGKFIRVKSVKKQDVLNHIAGGGPLKTRSDAHQAERDAAAGAAKAARK
jgi:hypothetical protein